MIRSILILTLIFFSFLPISAQEIEFTEDEKEWLKSHPVIYHGYDPNWAPFEFYNKKDSTYYGIVADYLKIIEEKSGIDFRPIPNLSWEETLSKLKTNEIDFATAISVTDNRKQFLNFTQPYISYPLVIVTRKDSDFIGGLKDLNKKNIALPKGYFTSEMISEDYPQINVTYTEGVKEALESVSYGNTDALVGNLAVISYYINKEGFTNLKIAAPTKYKHSEVSFGVRKDWPELQSVINKVLNSIPQEKHNAIKLDWIQIRYEHGINVRKIIKISAISLLVIMLIIGVILSWNRSLQNEIAKRNKIENKLEESLLSLGKKNEEKKTLLKEIHHRVKNNLQVVNSLLKFQSRKLEDDKAVAMFKETSDRVVSMAMLHEKMYRSDDVNHIDVKEYISLLVEDLVKNYAVDKDIKLNTSIEAIDLKMRTLVPLGLIINEMITNSLKHGFKGRSSGEITVQLKCLEGKKHEMIIGDNGVGVKKDKKTTGIGVKLIDVFTRQLNGTLEQLEQPGAVFKLVFEKIDLD